MTISKPSPYTPFYFWCIDPEYPSFYFPDRGQTDSPSSHSDGEEKISTKPSTDLEKFPTELKDKYRFEVTCSDFQERAKVLKIVVEKISRIYADFLTDSQGHRNIKGVNFLKIYKNISEDLNKIILTLEFPEISFVELFHKKLQDKIFEELKKPRNNDICARLIICKKPWGQLREVVEDCMKEAKPENLDDINYFFHCMTETKIYAPSDSLTISVEMGLNLTKSRLTSSYKKIRSGSQRLTHS